jgi:hypothetical protein
MSEIEIVNQLAERDRERVRGYRDLLEFYQGKQWQGRERWGEKRLTFNYSRVFVDKLTSYLMSGINFTVEALEDTPEALAAAERAEKALARVYEANGLEQLDFETETDCAILGDGCYKVAWDPDIKEIRVTAPDIQGIYVWWMGDNLSRVWRVAARYILSAEEVRLLYRIKTLNKSCVVVEIWTDKEFALYLDNVLLEKKPNPYGFIPFIIFPNLREPKKFWGTSDLVPVMESQRELNRAMSQVSHILELSGNPVAVLENVEGSSDIAVRPGAVWNIPEDAKAYLLDLLQGGGLQLHINYIDLLYRTLHDISESPRAAFGGTDRNLSGVAMQIELYPLMQKVIRKRLIRSSTYNRRNRLILKLLERFQGEKFGECSLRTVWGGVFPEDRAQTVANEQTLVSTGIHSRKRAMDEVGVKDPEAEFRHWLDEQYQITQIKETMTRNRELGK